MHVGIFLDTCKTAKQRLLGSLVRGIDAAGDRPHLVKTRDAKETGFDLAVIYGSSNPNIRPSISNARQWAQRTYGSDGRLFRLDAGFLPKAGEDESYRWWHRGAGCHSLMPIGSLGFHVLQCAESDDRWKGLGYHVRPWKPEQQPRRVLICGSTQPDLNTYGVSAEWVFAAARALREQGCLATLRPHPRIMEEIDPDRAAAAFDGFSSPFDETLEHAMQRHDVVVTIAGTPALHAVVAGIPAVTLHPDARAYPVTSHSLDPLEPLWRGDRQAWLNSLAYAQWSRAELEDGTAWRFVRDAAPLDA